MGRYTKAIKRKARDVWSSCIQEYKRGARQPWIPIAQAIDAAERLGAERALKGPVPELQHKIACVLYFSSAADRDEFMAVVREVKPGLVTRKL